MNLLNLIWIIPAIVFVGMFVRGLLRAGKDSD